jgi:hypothetical protein
MVGDKHRVNELKSRGKQGPVLKKCANPFCNQPYHEQGHGKAFVVQFPRRPLDHLNHRVPTREQFWLCADCSKIMSLAVRREFDTIAVRIINQVPGGQGKLRQLDQAEPAHVPPKPHHGDIDFQQRFF